MMIQENGEATVSMFLRLSGGGGGGGGGWKQTELEALGADF